MATTRLRNALPSTAARGGRSPLAQGSPAAARPTPPPTAEGRGAPAFHNSAQPLICAKGTARTPPTQCTAVSFVHPRF